MVRPKVADSSALLKPRLIEEVKKRRWMYDKKEKEYANRKDWFKMVAELINVDFAPFNIKCSGTELSNIWDELYNTFKKMNQAIKNAPSGSSAAILNIQKDPLYESLRFVEDTLQPRAPLSSIENLNGNSFTPTAQASSSFSNQVKSNFNMWQCTGGTKRKSKSSEMKSMEGQKKFKKSKKIGSNDTAETKEMITTLRKFVKQATDNVTANIKHEGSSTELNNDDKTSLHNMLTYKFLQLSESNVDAAFTEIRKGISQLFSQQ